MNSHPVTMEQTTLTVTQLHLGAQLMWEPEVGTPEHDRRVGAYIVGSGTLQSKRATIACDFFTTVEATSMPYPFTRTYHVSIPVLSPPASFASFGSFSSVASSPVVAKIGTKRALDSTSPSVAAPSKRLPGFSIMTRDGVDITENQSRGPKTKEQREHAAKMRKLGACPSCKKRKQKCEPSHHRPSAAATPLATSSSQQSRVPSLSGPSPQESRVGISPKSSVGAAITPPNAILQLDQGKARASWMNDFAIDEFMTCGDNLLGMEMFDSVAPLEDWAFSHPPMGQDFDLFPYDSQLDFDDNFFVNTPSPLIESMQTPPSLHSSHYPTLPMTNPRQPQPPSPGTFQGQSLEQSGRYLGEICGGAMNQSGDTGEFTEHGRDQGYSFQSIDGQKAAIHVDANLRDPGRTTNSGLPGGLVSPSVSLPSGAASPCHYCDESQSSSLSLCLDSSVSSDAGRILAISPQSPYASESGGLPGGLPDGRTQPPRPRGSLIASDCPVELSAHKATKAKRISIAIVQPAVAATATPHLGLIIPRDVTDNPLDIVNVHGSHANSASAIQARGANLTTARLRSEHATKVSTSANVQPATLAAAEEQSRLQPVSASAEASPYTPISINNVRALQPSAVSHFRIRQSPSITQQTDQQMEQQGQSVSTTSTKRLGTGYDGVFTAGVFCASGFSASADNYAGKHGKYETSPTAVNSSVADMHSSLLATNAARSPASTTAQLFAVALYMSFLATVYTPSALGVVVLAVFGLTMLSVFAGSSNTIWRMVSGGIDTLVKLDKISTVPTSYWSNWSFNNFLAEVENMVTATAQRARKSLDGMMGRSSTLYKNDGVGRSVAERRMGNRNNINWCGRVGGMARGLRLRVGLC